MAIENVLSLLKEPVKMKKIILFILSLSSIFICKAQNWIWAEGGIGNTEGTAVYTDGNGNPVITGFFVSPTVFGSNTLIPTGVSSAYIVKYNAAGSVLWAKSIYGGEVQSLSIGTDASGNVIVTGWFTGTLITFGTYTASGVGSKDIFIAKCDPNGNPIWIKSFGSSGDESGSCVKADQTGNIFLCGYYTATTLVIGSNTLSTGAANTCGYLIKFDQNCNPVWAKSTTGLYVQYARSISVDQAGNIFLTGDFNCPSMSFGTYTITNSNQPNSEMFLTKVSNSGNTLWMTNPSTSGYGSSFGRSVDVDGSGNGYVTGCFTNTSVVFGTYTLNSGNTIYPFYLTKYDPNGNVSWAVKSSGRGHSLLPAVSCYSDAVFVLSAFDTSIVLGTFTLNTLPNSYDPVFFARYDNQGNVMYAEAFTSGGDDWCGLKADKFCSVYISGDYNGNTFIIGSDTLTSGGGGEPSFLAKYTYTSNSCQSISPDFLTKESILNFNNSIFPNPGKGIFKLNLADEIIPATLTMYNIFGQKVLEYRISYSLEEINADNLPNGVYEVILQKDFQKISVSRIIIEK